jgi:hypothetical protein
MSLCVFIAPLSAGLISSFLHKFRNRFICIERKQCQMFMGFDFETINKDFFGNDRTAANKQR